MVKGRLNNELGQIEVRPEVIAAYAGSVAVECFGIVGMASVNMTDGLVRLLGRNKLGQGIQVLITPENKLRIAFHLIVAYGVNINAVSANLIENVKYRVEAFSGMEIEKIKIYVEDVRSIDLHRSSLSFGNSRVECLCDSQVLFGRCQRACIQKRMD